MDKDDAIKLKVVNGDRRRCVQFFNFKAKFTAVS